MVGCSQSSVRYLGVEVDAAPGTVAVEVSREVFSHPRSTWSACEWGTCERVQYVDMSGPAVCSLVFLLGPGGGKARTDIAG